MLRRAAFFLQRAGDVNRGATFVGKAPSAVASGEAKGNTKKTNLSSATPPDTAASTFINRIDITGVVHEIQTGFLKEDNITQFKLTTYNMNPHKFSSQHGTSFDLEEVGTATPRGKRNVAGASAKNIHNLRVDVPYTEKQHFQVKVVGSELAASVRNSLSEGVVARVVGQFKMNRMKPEIGPKGHDKAFPHPYVLLSEDAKGHYLRIVTNGKPGMALGARGVGAGTPAAAAAVKSAGGSGVTASTRGIVGSPM